MRVDRPDLPLANASADELARFREGDRLFELPFREPDGLGPLYIRASCEACHQADGRGPGLVPKMAVVEPDGVTPAADQSRLRFGPTGRPYVAAGARVPLGLPADHAGVRETFRLPPAVYGRGFIDAVSDAEIERVAALGAARSDGIRGRVHRLGAGGGGASAIGRFGLKARIATLDEFAADALQNDMGLTTPVRPVEPANPDGLTDDGKPGVDLPIEAVQSLAAYLRLLGLPPRGPADAGAETLFAEALCAACHVPAMATRPDYPVRALAGIAAPVYTDLLLHDMGADLADGVVDRDAGSREWRTAPLIGLRFAPRLMHDGRAHGVEEAVLAHEGPGSEANVAVARFRALGPETRARLIRFVETL